jgi:hypothetical protein
MSNVPNVQPPQHFLELIGRLYKKRDGILESANQLVDFSYTLQNCQQDELEDLQGKIKKVFNKIISDINELSPILENPNILSSIMRLHLMTESALEGLRFDLSAQWRVAFEIRELSGLTLMTRLKLTPKSIRKAYGVEIGMKDVLNLKGFFKHHQDNY